jgi:hypothetical protein
MSENKRKLSRIRNVIVLINKRITEISTYALSRSGKTQRAVARLRGEESGRMHK